MCQFCQRGLKVATLATCQVVTLASCQVTTLASFQAATLASWKLAPLSSTHFHFDLADFHLTFFYYVH